MNTNSAEYKTLIDQTEILCLAVRPDLTSLSGALLSKSLITANERSDLIDEHHSLSQRAAKLVESIQNKVQLNPSNYHTFNEVLARDPNQYGDTLQQLQSTYQSMCKFVGELSV